jgi:hypothetical protein
LLIQYNTLRARVNTPDADFNAGIKEPLITNYSGIKSVAGDLTQSTKLIIIVGRGKRCRFLSFDSVGGFGSASPIRFRSPFAPCLIGSALQGIN